MRNYEINEAQSRLAYGRLTWLVRMVSNWRMRKDFKRLQVFSDYQLRDMGLTRHELNHLSIMPLNTDTAWEMERRTLMNAKYGNLGLSTAPIPENGLASTAILAYPVWKERKNCLNPERH